MYRIFKFNRFNSPVLLALLAFLVLISLGCKKFLDLKPDKKLAEPKTIKDVQAMLNNYYIMNIGSPNLSMSSDDDFYLEDHFWKSLPAKERDVYIWSTQLETEDSWSYRYKIVLYANLALETLKEIGKTTLNKAQYEAAYGTALFFRGFAFFELAQIFATPYDSSTSMKTLGIPLRLASDLNTINKRNTLDETYNQIIKDVEFAVPLLPVLVSIPTRPSKASAFALLSNTYLAMRKYELAGLYADSALQLNDNLIDYNLLDTAAKNPFMRFNQEVIFHSEIMGAQSLYTSNRKVDTILYNSYETHDLRKGLFFQTTGPDQHGFKGSYNSDVYGSFFNGFAVDELLLIRAECEARKNNIETALEDLNHLLLKRYEQGFFEPIKMASVEDVLSLILKERRKELIGRSKRWIDLRRLNKEKKFETVLTRILEGNSYTLEPNSKRYTFPIPVKIIQMAGMQQNERQNKIERE